MVQVAPNYATAATNNRHALQTVDVTAITTGTGTPTLHFKPSATPVQLYQGGPVGTDDEYMIFGYWYQEPSGPAGAYAFDWFAEAVGGAATWPAGLTGTTVYYDGTAAGMYVEKDPNAAVDAYRHGEFVADVVLAAAGNTTDVTGTIDDFTTTPIGGSTAPVTSDRWVVELGPSNAVTLKGMAGTTTGAWNHAFVPAHPNAATDTPLPAVVGGFDARIDGSLAIVGAFGAESR